MDHRNEVRRAADCPVELTWRTEDGEKRLEMSRAIDLSRNGLAIETPESLPLARHVVVRAEGLDMAALAKVMHCKWNRTFYVAGLNFLARTSTNVKDGSAPDHYEILRLGPDADYETVERVYRTLAKRYHPDNEKTGDADIFLRIAEARYILSDPARRAVYDQVRRNSNGLARFEFDSREFCGGLKGEQNRRLGVLCILYRKRAVDPHGSGLTVLDLENLSGFTREELGFCLWYLTEKRLAKLTDSTEYMITAEGVDVVEGKLVSDDRTILRDIAAANIPAGS